MRKVRSRALTALVAAGALVLAACGGADAPSTSSAPSTTADTTENVTDCKQNGVARG